MNLVRRARARLREERGFTLVELLVTVSLGIIVLFASTNLIDASGRASTEVQDRVDATQRGRVALEQILQRLRAQACPDKSTPAIVQATDDSVRFYAELGSSTFTPDGRELTFANGAITEKIWNTLATPFSATFAGAPSATRTIIRDADRAGGAPIFRYYAFVGNDPAKPELLLQTPLSATDMARVVKIAVSFDSRPTRLASQANRIDTTFDSEVFVRTADPTDPEHSPQCE